MARCILILAMVLAPMKAAGQATDEHQDLLEELAMYEALTQRLRVGKTYIAHCRSAPGGCERRVATLSHLIVRACRRHGIDPWLLAAMAVRESGLNPDARGAMGELGVLQLHPYSAPGIRARMVCKRAPSDCTAAVVDEGAAHLASKLRQCGDIESALTAYNSRSGCGPSDYANRVMREWEWFWR
jgi:hypothetical protein